MLVKNRSNMNKSKKCEVCNFFERTDAIERVAAGRVGLCRYNPPLIMENMSPVAQWPVVNVEDWCGKFAN